MQDEKTLKLSDGSEGVIRTRVTMKDKHQVGRVKARMLDLSITDGGEQVTKVDMAARVDLDELLMKLFVVSVAGKQVDVEDLDAEVGQEMLDAIWDANGKRLGINKESVFETEEQAAEGPKGTAKN